VIPMYYPPPESKGGWRVLADADSVRLMGEIDQGRLVSAWEYSLHSQSEPTEFYPAEYHVPRANSSSVLVIRHGYIVGEWYQNADKNTVWNVYSCTKSFTGTAYGILLQNSTEGKLRKRVTLDSPAYKYIPEGHPVTDARKRKIKIRHLLTMTSCIKGENSGVFGIHFRSPPRGCGPFEFALGRCPTVGGKWVSKLTGDPGTRFGYSDPAFEHLSLIFYDVMRREIDGYLKEKVLDPIGVENFVWDRIGGDGNIGPHTLSSTGIHITARDLARFGYLALNKGLWTGRQLVPSKWMKMATEASQPLNKNYGYTWWVNTAGTCWEDVPRDTFAAMGFAANKCYVIPSLDLVVVRIGDGPWPWNDTAFLRKVMSSVL